MSELKDGLKTITVKEALTFPEGTPIPRMVGKIALLWERTEGDGKWGHWTKQAGLLEDEYGNKMVFTVWGKPDLEESKGRKMVFRCSGGKKPSMTLKADYKDSSKMTINVGKSAFVLTEEEDTDDIPYDKPTETAAKNRETFTDGMLGGNNAPKPIVEPKRAIPDSLGMVKHRLMQFVNLRKLTDAAVESLYGDSQHADNKKDVSSCFFIQAMREGLEKNLPDNKPIDAKPTKEIPEEKEPEFLPAEAF